MRWRMAAFAWNDPTTKKEIRAATSRKLTLRLNAPSTYTFTILGDHPQAALITELVTDVVVRGGSEDMIRARVGNTQDSVGDTGYSVSFNSADYRAVLKRRALKAADRLSYNSVDQGTIAWNMVQDIQSRTNGNYGITQGVGGTTGISRQWSPKQGSYVGAEIDSMANMSNGFDWDVSPAMALNIYYPSRGANNGVGLEYGKTITDFTRNKTSSGFANDIVGTGGQSVAPVEQASATVATDPQGRWDATVGFPDINTQDNLTAKTGWAVGRMGLLVPVYTVKLKPGFWRGTTHIGLGDTVRLRVQRGRINDNLPLRVLEIAVDIQDDGDEDVQLSLGGV